jgi:hypothetical protein
MTKSFLCACADYLRNIMATTTTNDPATADLKVIPSVEEEKKAGLFAQCVFAIVGSAAWPEEDRQSVCRLAPLNRNHLTGARLCPN